MSQEFAYIPYLNVAQQTINMANMVIAIVLFAQLLSRVAFGRKNTFRDISGSLRFYMIYHFIGAITAFPGSLYQMKDHITVLQYSDLRLHKDWPDQLGYWFGIFSMNYIFVAPVPTLFLTLDRCLVLKFKWAYTKRLRNRLLIANCIATCSVYLAVTGTSMRELPLQVDKIMNCIIPTCFMRRFGTYHYFYTRLVVESTNVLLSIYFFVMLWQHHQTAQTSLRTRVVKLTLMADIAFSMVPNYFQLIFNTITGVSLGLYLGAFATTTFMFYPAFCKILTPPGGYCQPSDFTLGSEAACGCVLNSGIPRSRREESKVRMKNRKLMTTLLPEITFAAFIAPASPDFFGVFLRAIFAEPPSDPASWLCRF